MQSPLEEREDIFFDSLDYVSTSFEETATENSESESNSFDYKIWISELGNIHERRDRFLQRIGFDELVPSRMRPSQEIREDCRLPEQLGLERITECSGAILDPLSSASKGRGWYSDCCVGDLDSDKKFVVHEQSQDDLLSPLSETRSDRMITWKEFEASLGISYSVQQLVQRKDVASGAKHGGGLDTRKKKSRSWWNCFSVKWGSRELCKCDFTVKNSQVPKTMRMRVQHCRKSSVEFTAVYMGQDFQAHKGSIWTMKFSPCGRYLASGGEDCVVRIWRVMEVDASCICLRFVDKEKKGKLILKGKHPYPAPIVIPKMVFKIEETPLHEFHGHISDVLDLCWSTSNCLLTSSKDKTVRMWQVGQDQCLQVFRHNNYVTCIQFNSADEGYFISGSIDGKVRIWGISESRVVDWVDVRDIITAVCYRPNGQGFVVGTITGNCRFYDSSGNNLRLDAEFYAHGRKKSSRTSITGFQFSPEDSEKIMITSADSKVRIVDGVKVIHKYRGLRKSRGQLSASFTSDGRYIVSIGEDSHIYIWSYSGSCVPSSKGSKSVRSCEYFFSEGASVAIPWPGMDDHRSGLRNSSVHLQCPRSFESPTRVRDTTDRFTLGAWFFADCPSRLSVTWPEEKLSLWVEEPTDHTSRCPHDSHHHHHQQHRHLKPLSATWSRVIVTAGRDGSIRSFHNYGLPVRL